MISFKKFIKESYTSVPVVDLDISIGADVTLPEIKNELNRNISLIFRQQYKTVQEAIVKLRKVLSMYNLDLPQIEDRNNDKGTITIPVGEHHVVWDEFTGELKDYDGYNIKFSYQLIDGLYRCNAKLI